jgi:hypothetical protein
MCICADGGEPGRGTFPKLYLRGDKAVTIKSAMPHYLTPLRPIADPASRKGAAVQGNRLSDASDFAYSQRN